MRKKYKISLGVLIILSVAFCIIIMFDSDLEIYIVEPQFNGQVLVIFDQPNGQKKEFSSRNERIYRIPKNGILRTQFNPNNGLRLLKSSYETFLIQYGDSTTYNSFQYTDIIRENYKGTDVTYFAVGIYTNKNIEEILDKQIKN